MELFIEKAMPVYYATFFQSTVLVLLNLRSCTCFLIGKRTSVQLFSQVCALSINTIDFLNKIQSYFYYWYYITLKNHGYICWRLYFITFQISFKSCNCFHLFSIAISLNELFERKIILSSCGEFLNLIEVLPTHEVWLSIFLLLFCQLVRFDRGFQIFKLI